MCIWTTCSKLNSVILHFYHLCNQEFLTCTLLIEKSRDWKPLACWDAHFINASKKKIFLLWTDFCVWGGGGHGEKALGSWLKLLTASYIKYKPCCPMQRSGIKVTTKSINYCTLTNQISTKYNVQCTGYKLESLSSY